MASKLEMRYHFQIILLVLLIQLANVVTLSPLSCNMTFENGSAVSGGWDAASHWKKTYSGKGGVEIRNCTKWGDGPYLCSTARRLHSSCVLFLTSLQSTTLAVVPYPLKVTQDQLFFPSNFRYQNRADLYLSLRQPPVLLKFYMNEWALSLFHHLSSVKLSILCFISILDDIWFCVSCRLCFKASETSSKFCLQLRSHEILRM